MICNCCHRRPTTALFDVVLPNPKPTGPRTFTGRDYLCFQCVEIRPSDMQLTPKNTSAEQMLDAADPSKRMRSYSEMFASGEMTLEAETEIIMIAVVDDLSDISDAVREIVAALLSNEPAAQVAPHVLLDELLGSDSRKGGFVQ